MELDSFLDEEKTIVGTDISRETLSGLLNELHDKWCAHQLDSEGQQVSAAQQRFGLSDADMGSFEAINHARTRAKFQALRLMSVFAKKSLIGTETDETIEITKKFSRISAVITHLGDMLLMQHRVRRLTDSSGLQDEDDVPDEISLFHFSPINYADNKPYQNFLLYLLKRLSHWNFRRKGQSCWEQIMTQPTKEQPRSFATHAWKPVCHISQFMYRECDKSVQYKQWANLTTGDTVRNATEYLKNCRDNEFLDYAPRRHVFSYDDAIYDMKARQVYRFGVDPIPSDLIACRFFNKPLNIEALSKHKDWYDIPTPVFQGILDFQGLEPAVCRVLYLMIGRLMYDINEMDRWELILFIKGVANSGKSTIGRMIKSFYSPTDTVILSSNMETKFGLQALLDKYLFICYEVKKDFGLNQADFQSMITGEEVSVAQKFKDALTQLLKCSGVLFGNENANWVDAQGSMSRRLLTFEFPKKVLKSNTTLGRDLENELPAIMYKCNEAYHMGVLEYGGGGLAPELPAYFQNTQKDMKEQINTLSSFLSSDALVKHPGYYIPLRKFSELFQQHCVAHNLQKTPMTADHYKSIFEEEGLVVKKETLPWDGKPAHTATYILGIGHTDDFANPADEAQDAESDVPRRNEIESKRQENEVKRADKAEKDKAFLCRRSLPPVKIGAAGGGASRGVAPAPAAEYSPSGDSGFGIGGQKENRVRAVAQTRAGPMLDGCTKASVADADILTGFTRFSEDDIIV